MINDIIKRQPCICRSFGHVKAYSTQWVNFSVTLNFLGPGRSRLLGFEKKNGTQISMNLFHIIYA